MLRYWRIVFDDKGLEGQTGYLVFTSDGTTNYVADDNGVQIMFGVSYHPISYDDTPKPAWAP